MTGDIDTLLSPRAVVLADHAYDHPSRVDIYRTLSMVLPLSMLVVIEVSMGARERGASATLMERETDYLDGVREESSSPLPQGLIRAVKLSCCQVHRLWSGGMHP